jgi:hypothetical protein
MAYEIDRRPGEQRYADVAPGVVEKLIDGQWVIMAGTPDIGYAATRLDCYGEPGEVRVRADRYGMGGVRARRKAEHDEQKALRAGKPLTPQERADILVAAARGETYTDLAVRYGCAPETVARVVRGRRDARRPVQS